MKSGVLFVLFLSSISLFTCSPQPNDIASGGITLNLQVVEKPSAPNIFSPGQPSLPKTAGIVEDQVVLLHCDEDSGYVAYDASAYGNDFSLYNVTWDSAATTDDQHSLQFNGRDAYALSESYDSNHDELNGTHGLTISMKVFAIGTDLYYEKRLLDRRDATGGYTLGIHFNHFYFSVSQDAEVITIEGSTTLVPRVWYTVVARFSDGALSLAVNGTPEGESVILAGQISPSTRQTVIGAGWTPTSGVPVYHFHGRLDEISIRSAVEYVDFESLLVAVIDIAEFNNVNGFLSSEEWQHYQMNFYTFFADTTSVPTWDHWKQLWTNSGFTITSEQTLTIRGAFAEGQVRGIEGLNLLAIAGIQKGEITYYGTGYLLVIPGMVNEARVEIWPAEF